jgi:predicted metal-dependent TIM-barrel fold hydrolase
MIAYIGLEQGCTRKQLIAIMIAIGIHPDTAAKQYNDIRRTFKSAA